MPLSATICPEISYGGEIYQEIPKIHPIKWLTIAKAIGYRLATCPMNLRHPTSLPKLRPHQGLWESQHPQAPDWRSPPSFFPSLSPPMPPSSDVIPMAQHLPPSAPGLSTAVELAMVNTNESPSLSALQEEVAKLNREQHKIQNLLTSLGFALRSFNNLNQFLEITPLMSARVADADGGALLLFKDNGQIQLEKIHCQEGQACTNVRQALEVVSRQLSQENRQQPPVAKGTIPCPQSLDGEVRRQVGAGVKVFSTPILVKNVERGRMYIFSADPAYDWNQNRRKLVQLVADQTAVAIANNDLTFKLRQKERQDRELEIASEIQLHLLPQACPQIPGLELAAECLTASRVGGDYYDFIPVQAPESDRPQTTDLPWSIVIGDVMGKGVPAGLIMTMTRGMLRAEILNRHSPAKILERLNRVMFPDLENSHRFVTLFYSEYDPQSRCLSFSNAAHNPPLWWQAQTKTIDRLDTWGMLIGLEQESQYENGQVQLGPGDVVLYYTDGFTDAANPQGDRFDEENLYRAFEWGCEHYHHPQGILDHIFQEVQRFVGQGNRHSDDMTLVVMRVTSF